jgi:hypothetical protein
VGADIPQPIESAVVMVMMSRPVRVIPFLPDARRCRRLLRRIIASRGERKH